MPAAPVRSLPRLSPVDLSAGLVLGSLLLALRWKALMRWAAIGEALADAAQPFERHVDEAHKRVLVIGDSTGVGTGAKQAADSLAGRLAQAFPGVHIVNRARNGAKTADACRQLAASAGERFDVVLIHVGGNDILRRTPWRQLVADVETLLREASRLGTHVLVTTTPNVGLAPAFFAPLSWWLTLRSRQVRDLFTAACARHGAHYANFFHPRDACPFARDWQVYFAEDRLHPSSECYGYVWRALVAGTPLAHWLAAPASAPADLGANVDQFGEEGDVERTPQESHAG